MSANKENGWLAYCRPGFESECAQELQAEAEARGVVGYIRTRPGDAYVRFIAGGEIPDISPAALVFPRQVLRLEAAVSATDPRDRLTPLSEVLDASGEPFCDVYAEAPDSDADPV